MTIEKNIGYKLTIISIILGVIAISQSYFLAYKGDFNYTFFWIGILLGIVPTLILVMNMDGHKDNDFKNLILLFLLGFLFYMPLIFWSPTYFRFNDEILHLNSLEMILQKGNLDINPVLEMSRYYPGLEFLTIFFMKFTGFSPFVAAKVSMGIIHSLVLVFIYFTFRTITSSQKIAALGSIIYIASPGYIFFDAVFSYETVGILLIVILIYLLYKHSSSNNEKFGLSVVSTIVLFALIITHHFSSYMFSIFLVLMYISYHFYSSDIMNTKYIARYTALTIATIIVWIIYGAETTIDYFGNMVSTSISSILSFLTQGVAQREPFRLTTLPGYELFIDKYVFIPMIFLLYVYCIYSIIRDRRKDINARYIDPRYVSLILYGSLFFISIPLIFTMAGKLFMYRSWSFSFIGLSLAIAIASERLFNMKVKIMKIPILIPMSIPMFIIIILIIMGGNSIGSSSSYREPKNLDASIPSSITSEIVIASDWFETHFNSRNLILGDATTYFVFSAYGNQLIKNDQYLFYKDIIDPESIQYVFENFGGKFIIVDNRITEKLSATRYYFNDEELGIEYPWGYKSPLPKKNIEKFNKYIGLYRVYDNGNIYMYRVGNLYGLSRNISESGRKVEVFK